MHCVCARIFLPKGGRYKGLLLQSRPPEGGLCHGQRGDGLLVRPAADDTRDVVDEARRCDKTTVHGHPTQEAGRRVGCLRVLLAARHRAAH